jgi:hypothetical protein
MKGLKSSVVTLGVGLILSQSGFAQPQAQKLKAPPKNVTTKEKSAAKLEAERIRKERQAEVRFLLVALATDARTFRDQALRARSLARIADALWEVDAEQARTLFRKAWEAAEIAYRESNERHNIRDGVVALKPEEINAAKFASIASMVDLRKDVLRLVAPRDRMLSEEFLEKVKESQAENKSDDANSSLWGLADAEQQRLSLAENLLRGGNVERALQLADSVLGRVTISTVDFLSLLREKDPAAADRRYAAMLASTGNNMAIDANTVSLLSSYIFTPRTYIIFNAEGGASYSGRPNSIPANVSPQLRQAFFQSAGMVLLRPWPPPEQDRSSTCIAGKYLVVKHLLPLFEQYAPGEITASVRGQFEALTSQVSDNVRRGETAKVPEELTEDKSVADLEESLLNEIEHADTSDKRDQLYFDLALLALKKDDLKARDYAGKIEESGFRKQAEAWVDWGLAVSAIQKRKTERALELNRTGEFTHIQRVWILTQAARQLGRADRTKASSLIDTATAEARRIDGSDLDRPRGLFAIANALQEVEPGRVSEAMFDAVKAANSTEGFTGEGTVIMQSMNAKGLIRVNPQPVAEFDIEGVFGALANDDYERAVQLARGFQAEAPRANATIAIARSVLRETGARNPTP